MEAKKDKVSSIYIHIPFCDNICSYCDFCKLYYNKKFIKDYLDSLEREISLYYKDEEIDTLYIGGGTPSCLSMDELERLFSVINTFNLKDDLEFTFECNLCDINEELLSFLSKSGVNRLSIGVQSFSDKVLSILGRKSFSYDKILLAKKYFDNINIDLIYGVNGQSLNDLNNDLDMFFSLDINHLSIYSLILEDRTILKINNYTEIDEDLNRDMYDLICMRLKDNNYEHYEISNFSKKGFNSRHNLVYWNNLRYYGFGLGASGYLDNIRYSNTRSITSYIKGVYRDYEEVISKEVDMENFMMLGLRKLEGVSDKDFYDRYNVHISDIFDTKKLDKNGDNYYINENNIYISNYIICDFIK